MATDPARTCGVTPLEQAKAMSGQSRVRNLEFKVSLVGAITSATGLVRADGNILTVGRRIGAGKLLAHATTTCLVMPL